MRRRTVLALGIAGAVLVAGGTTAAIWRPWEAPAAAEGTSSVQTVIAERTTLTSDVLLAGQLSYGDVVALPSAQGTITWLPAVGAEIAAGQALYELNGDPVIAVTGSRPFWRELATDIAAGADVVQLEAFLVAGGYGDLTVDETFT